MAGSACIIVAGAERRPSLLSQGSYRLLTAWMLAAATAVLNSGCASLRAPDTRSLAADTDFWQPHLLLSAPEPYPSLYVEIDAVEGSAPDPRTVEDLRAFLERLVRKPGGVRAALDDVIPLDAARGRSSRSLALEYIDGPPDPDHALIYLFFYDSRRLPDRKSAPATTLLPYPVSVFIDTAYTFMDTTQAGNSGRGPGEFGRLALFHEAGHVLGLCRGASHSDGLHCTREDCLMSPKLAFDVSRFVTLRDPWRQRDLCPDCRAELQAHTAARPAANLRFLGPYVVRSEPGYHVLALPGFVYVQVGALEDLDRERLHSLRRNAARTNQRGRVTYASSIIDRDEAPSVLPALMRDPFKLVRDLGRGLRQQLDASP